MMPDTTSGAAAPHASVVNRNAPKKGAGFFRGARSLARVRLIPEPKPLPKPMTSAVIVNHTAADGRSCVNAKTMSGMAMPNIDGTIAASRPNRSITCPLQKNRAKSIADARPSTSAVSAVLTPMLTAHRGSRTVRPVRRATTRPEAVPSRMSTRQFCATV